MPSRTSKHFHFIGICGTAIFWRDFPGVFGPPALALVGWVALRGPVELPDGQPLWWTIGLIVLVPAVQLIPLPPALWQVHRPQSHRAN